MQSFPPCHGYSSFSVDDVLPPVALLRGAIPPPPHVVPAVVVSSAQTLLERSYVRQNSIAVVGSSVQTLLDISYVYQNAIETTAPTALLSDRPSSQFADAYADDIRPIACSDSRLTPE